MDYLSVGGTWIQMAKHMRKRMSLTTDSDDLVQNK